MASLKNTTAFILIVLLYNACSTCTQKFFGPKTYHGTYRHKYNCQLFYQCHYGTCWEFTCGSGRGFYLNSDGSSGCDYLQNLPHCICRHGDIQCLRSKLPMINHMTNDQELELFLAEMSPNIRHNTEVRQKLKHLIKKRGREGVSLNTISEDITDIKDTLLRIEERGK